LLTAGPVVGGAVVGLGAPLQSRTEKAALGRWYVASTAPWRSLHLTAAPRTLFVVAVIVFVGLWALTGLVLTRRRTSPGRVLAAAGAWATPFALGVPLLSRDVYAYAAQGALMQGGLDPYRVPVRALGRSAAVLTVDPMWRGTGTPSGPFALRVEQLCSALAGGDLLVNIVLLRALAVLCAGGIVLLVWQFAPPATRSNAVWLACSPLVLCWPPDTGTAPPQPS
jgi:hypothetical protein